MSYARMDHAAWLESDNKATNRYNAASRGKRNKRTPLPESLNEFQRKVADILGMTGGGIYNAPIACGSIDWNWGMGVSVTWRGGLATFDRGDLTMLVLLCHEARIRLDISPAGPHLLRLSFWQRRAQGGYAERHPSIDEAVSSFREYLPSDHHVRWRADIAKKEVA